MLSLFPSLLTFGMFSPLLLRLTLGFVFCFWSYRILLKKSSPKNDGKKMARAMVDGLVGILFIIGLFTQLAALLATINFLWHILRKIKDKAFLTNGVNYYFILLVISLCLLLTGPGALAFDLPL